jgi:hypothetical protein
MKQQRQKRRSHGSLVANRHVQTAITKSSVDVLLQIGIWNSTRQINCDSVVARMDGSPFLPSKVAAFSDSEDLSVQLKSWARADIEHLTIQKAARFVNEDLLRDWTADQFRSPDSISSVQTYYFPMDARGRFFIRGT